MPFTKLIIMNGRLSNNQKINGMSNFSINIKDCIDRVD